MRSAVRICAVAAAAFLVASSPAVGQQSFSCSYGTEPACLDYGAVVCRSSAMCVDRSAICFDSYTCDYKGFVCKSKFDDAVEEIDTKVNAYNTLADDFNRLRSEHTSLLSCVEDADTIEEAKRCQ